MLATQRHSHILAAVRAHGAVRVADLVDQLDVSDMTVRRDISELHRAGLVRRVHGGAVAPSDPARPTDEPGFEAKRTWATAEKSAIARAALATIEPGQSIALSAGTTTHLLALLIAGTPTLRPLTVVTNSLAVVDALRGADQAASGGLDVVLTGGVRTPSDALVGPVADAALHRLRVDQTFLGVHGVDATGVTTPNLLEAATNQALIACAHRVTVLADHTKWGVVGLAQIADLTEIDALISDDALSAEARTVLAGAVGRLHLAATDTGAPTRSPARTDSKDAR